MLVVVCVSKRSGGWVRPFQAVVGWWCRGLGLEPASLQSGKRCRHRVLRPRGENKEPSHCVKTEEILMNKRLRKIYVARGKVRLQALLTGWGLGLTGVISGPGWYDIGLFQFLWIFQQVELEELLQRRAGA
ncbi:hypothetical protein TNIN_342531 [Trichonephila inaurata madagascariensis]|uniref:Uncharacterized protein n=1 Tax=Trichonephila inaurata madagascariensis TaxID=2747483 RepID=A0A8X6WM13_9ARAC|nr:hypothetical protein TNIN_342531 [Trichonephila inaurata madagascariensis]